MTPKFAVGEVVILQSEQKPEFNGECEVIKVLSYGEVHGFQKVNAAAFGYVLTVNDELWSELALRKKHQPGELSFDKLMSSLSQPVQEPSHS